jgi:tetratricopeptide (TPR) repeat protein
MKLAKLRTDQLIRNAIARARASTGKRAVEPGRSLMATMIGEKRIRFGDPIHRMAERGFKANLEDIVDVAQQHKVPVILSTLTSNLRDLPPFDSAHRDGFDEAQRRRVDRALENGSTDELKAAVALDTTYARARYALAQRLEADTTQIGAVRREYIGARDHDVVHFRACTRFNDIIREVATAHQVPLLDMDAVFATATPRRAPGLNLFLEHLHPNLRGSMLMADAFHDAMEKNRIIPDVASPPRSYEQRISDAGLTALDIELARQRIESMTGQWPFQHAYETEFPKAPANVAQVARGVLENRLDLVAAHEALGREYLAAKDLPRALEEYRALAKIFPVSPSGPINTADILLQMRRPAEAIPWYQDGLALDPNSVQTRLHLAHAYHATGDTRAARDECNRILAAHPQYQGAMRLLRQLRVERSD